MIFLDDDEAAAWHTWFAWYPVVTVDLKGCRPPEKFWVMKWMTKVYRRSVHSIHGRHWVYSYEDPYDGYEK